MLDKKGFDLWADEYDRSVGLCEQSDEYPFAGYQEVLNRIYQTVHSHSVESILDIGFGTAVLTSKLYQEGYKITGVDFSDRMIEIAQSKMPEAKLFQCDFVKGLPNGLKDEQFDCILSTYALHHVSEKAMPRFLMSLLDRLKPSGMLLIGDVAFQTRADWERCRMDSGDNWDQDESYFIVEELAGKVSEKIHFDRISYCSGVLQIQK